MIPGLAERLKIERKKSGYTQVVVSDLSGITAENLSKYENDTTTPPIEALYKLSAVYKVSMDYLVGLDQSKNVFVARDLTDEQIEVLKVVMKYMENHREK